MTATERAVLIRYRVEGEWRRGSGLRVGGGYVLTADHCGRGEDHTITVDGETYPAVVHVRTGRGDIDVALLCAPDLPPLPHLSCALVDTAATKRITECVVLGYPLWKNGQSAQVHGWVPAGEGNDPASIDQIRLLALKSDAPDIQDKPIPAGPLDTPANPWGGMSGAVVLTDDDRILGVLRSHGEAEGVGGIDLREARFVDRNHLPADTATRFWAALRVTDPHNLPRLPDRDAKAVPGVMPPPRALTPERLEAMREISLQVGLRCDEEVEILGLAKPKPMPVRWIPAPAAVTDHPSTVFPYGTLPPTEVRSDDIASLADNFIAGNRRRLVILGDAGTGKTTLSQLLVKELLRHPGKADPVPVWLSLASWDIHAYPRFSQWLVYCITRDFPQLIRGFADDIAQQLVDNKLLLPVLDGLDEIDELLQPMAIKALDAYLSSHDRIVLTCRTAEYRAAVARSKVLTGAEVIEAQPLTPTEIKRYLETSIHNTQPARLPLWRSTLDRLDTPTGAALADFCSTPLGLWMLRAVYIDGTTDRQPHPATLLDARRFPDSAAIKSSLFGELIPAVIKTREPDSTHSDSLRPHRRWDPTKAERWLGYIANELEGRRDIHWWQLHRPFDRRWPRWPKSRRAQQAIIGAGVVAAAALVLMYFYSPGLVASIYFAGALSAALYAGVLRFNKPPEPVSVESRGFWGHIASQLGRGPTKWFYLGSLVVGPIVGVRWSLRHHGHPSILAASLLGLILTPALALVADFGDAATKWIWPRGSDCSCDSCVRSRTIRSRTPGSSFRNARRRTMNMATYTAAFGGIPGGIAFIAWICATNDTGRPLTRVLESPKADGLLLALGMAVVLLAGTIGLAVGLWSEPAWFSYVASTKSLAIRGKLPWRTMQFLEDAHRLGLLRTAGVSFQFRHAELQDHLDPPEHRRQIPDPHAALFEEWPEWKAQLEAGLQDALDRVDTLRPLAAVDPDKYGRSLAKSLINLAEQRMQFLLDDVHGAIAARAAAVDVYRDLLVDDPDIRNPNNAGLGKALDGLAGLYEKEGNKASALAARTEASEIFRMLAVEEPQPYAYYFASCLAKLTRGYRKRDHAMLCATWDDAIAAMPTNCAVATLRAEFSFTLNLGGLKEEAAHQLTLAAETVDVDAPGLDNDYRAIEFVRMLVRSHARFGASTELPSWATASSVAEASLTAAQEFTSAVGWPRIREFLVSLPGPDALGELRADIAVIAAVFPTNPRNQALLNLIDEITVVGNGETIAHYQNQFEQHTLRADWLTEPTLDESRTTLRSTPDFRTDPAKLYS